MNTHEEIRTSLLHDEGSCRDINLVAPTWEGIARVLDSLTCIYSTHRWDVAPEKTALPLHRGEHLRLILEDRNALLSHLQVFIFCENDGSPFVEFTFFPEDVKDSPDLPAAFIGFVKELQRQAGASGYFVRFENASWSFGDCSHGSGVFAWSEGAP